MRRPRPLRLPALVLAMVAAATACSALETTVGVSGEPRADVAPTSIPTFLEGDEQDRFTTLLACVDLAGASSAVAGTGPVTLFAPTNEAFADADISCDEDAALDEAARDGLLRTLQQHVVDYDVRFAPPEGYDPQKPPRLLELVTNRSLTLDSVLTDAPGTSLVIGPDKTVRTQAASGVSAKIIDADLQAPNGIVHVIDTVLVPPEKAELPPTTVAPQPYE